MKRRRIHARNMLQQLLGLTDFPIYQEDVDKVRKVVNKFNFISYSSFNKATREVPWLEELFLPLRYPFKTMSWSEPYYSPDELPTMIKELKSIEPLIAKLRIAGVL